MKMEMKLVKVTTTQTETGTTDTVVFIPTRKELREYVDLRVKGPICADVLHTLGMPNKIGDTVEVDVILKGAQAELPGGDKPGKKGRNKIQKD